MSRLAFEPIRSYQLCLFADYFQIYLHDKQATEEWEVPDNWDYQLISKMIGIAPGTITIGTVRNMKVPVEIQLLTSRPPDDLAVGDHITEASLAIPSGELVILGCSDYLPDATHIPVQPGSYLVWDYLVLVVPKQLCCCILSSQRWG